MITAPLAIEIIAARAQANHTQQQAAAMVYLGNRQRWAEYERGVAAIDLARWELYLLLTDQHPELSTCTRSKT